jgi:Cu2+-exporting ATPase
MVQRLDALEALAAMSRLYTDKTGTLTEERPQWARTVLLQDGQTDARELMRLAASLATWSTHPRSRWLAADVRHAGGLAPGASSRGGARGDGRAWRPVAAGALSWVRARGWGAHLGRRGR